MQKATRSPNDPVNPPVNETEKNVNSDQNGDLNTNTNAPPVREEPDGLPTVYEAELKRVLAANRLNFPSGLNALRSESGTLMGEPDEGLPFALRVPVGRIIMPDRPQLVWHPLEGAEYYSV